jgi:ketosteroid isomerase-like protein
VKNAGAVRVANVAARVAIVSALVATVSAPAALHAHAQPIDVEPLPLAATRLPASADECAVWRRERDFARTVERHDLAAFASYLHRGAVFDAGSVDAERGRAAITASWRAIVEGKTIALRWRPGVVQIGGEPGIALSRGPYVLQRMQEGGAASYRVGLFQTVWLRDAGDDAWRVLFDGSATTSQPVEDRAAADRWVEAQAMSDCAP